MSNSPHSAVVAGLALAVVLALSSVPAGAVAVGASGGVGVPDAVDAPGDRPVQNATDAPTITVSATGDAAAAPDTVLLFVASEAVAATPLNATERLAANTTRLRRALFDAGVAREDLRTTGFDVFETRPRPNATPEYRAVQSFRIAVRNVSRAGAIVDVAVANGATRIDGVSFALSEATRERLRQEALREAVAGARREAATVAAAANLTLVGVRSISVGGFAEPSPVAREFQAADSDTTIDPGPVVVTASVQVQFDAAGEAGGNRT